MSTAQTGSNVPKRKSFAQVAAAANKPAIPQVKTPNNTVDSNNNQNATSSENEQTSPAEATQEDVAVPEAHASNGLPASAIPGSLNRLMKETSINDRSAPSSSVENLGPRDNSDTKSITSRTTMTFDEKESLMPDDSASMQGGRDQEVNSPAESVNAAFRLDANKDALAFRDQLFEIEKSAGKRLHIAQRPISSGSVPQQQNGAMPYPTNAAPPQPPEVILTREQSSGPPPGLEFPPDSKLLDALNSPKDRLFVLKIEQDFIDFIKNSKDVELQLPSTNTFYRLLSHKLAEYYLLGHVYEDSLKAVRIRKLPHTRLAPPLQKDEPKSESTTPPPPNSMKIMRRGQGGPNALALDSRPQSSGDYAEFGIDDEKEGQKRPRDKSGLTREEREKQYEEARARIFQGFDEKQGNSGETSGNQSKEMSRSSSHSGAKKNKRGKRPKDDSFEARSSYTSVDGQQFINNSFIQAQGNAAFFNPAAQYPQYPAMPMQYQMPPQGYQMQQQDFGNAAPWQAPQQYAQPYQMQPNMPAYGQYPQQSFDQSAGYYGSPPNMPSQSTPKAQHPSLAGYFPYQPQGNDGAAWMQPGFQGVYQQNVFSPDGTQQAYMVPYGYDPNFQQPQAFNGYAPAFNPQSQAFVPGGQMSPMAQWPQQPQTPGNFSPGFQQGSPGRNGNANGHGHGQGQGHGQGKKGKQGSAGQQNGNQNGSIAKWAGSSSLPAKPPPTTSSLSFQMPKHMEQGQPLPSKPLK